MQNISYFTDNPGLNFTAYLVQVPDFEPCTHLTILEKRPDDPAVLNIPCESDSLYIGNADAVVLFLKSIAATDCRVLNIALLGNVSTASVIADFIQKLHLNFINLLISDSQLASSCNNFSRELNRYMVIRGEFQRIIYRNEGLEDLMDLAYNIFQCPISFLTAGYSLISSRGQADSGMLNADLKTHGYLNFETLGSLPHQELPSYSSICKVVRYEQDASAAPSLLFSVSIRNREIGAFLIEPMDEVSAFAVKHFHEFLVEALQNMSVNNPHLGKYSSNTALESLIKDLIEFRVQNQDEINNRLQLMHKRIDGAFYIMVVEFNNMHMHPVPINYVMGRMEALFPQAHVTNYLDDILLLIPSVDRIPLIYDEAALNRLLIKYNACAGISNLTIQFLLLNTFYQQTKSAIRFGRYLDPDKHIFFYEDYRIMDIIDMCSDSFQAKYHHGNLIYMCDPAVLWLERYDQQHSSNLRQVLFEFLKNNCNATKTAREMHMHRNTMLNKISKIEEIIGRSLSDGIVQQNLFFSYLALRYLEDFRGEVPYTGEKIESRKNTSDTLT